MTREAFIRTWADRLSAHTLRGYFSSDPPEHKFRRMQTDVSSLESELGKLFDSMQPAPANGKPATIPIAGPLATQRKA